MAQDLHLFYEIFVQHIKPGPLSCKPSTDAREIAICAGDLPKVILKKYRFELVLLHETKNSNQFYRYIEYVAFWFLWTCTVTGMHPIHEARVPRFLFLLRTNNQVFIVCSRLHIMKFLVCLFLSLWHNLSSIFTSNFLFFFINLSLGFFLTFFLSVDCICTLVSRIRFSR